jgi:hypothetical protein
VGWLLALLKDACLRVPTRFRLERVSSYYDGGTTDLYGRDEHGHSRRIRLTQQMFAPVAWSDPPVGRLYLGWRRVPVRGRAETAVLVLVDRLLAEQQAAGPAEGESEALHAYRLDSLRRILEYVRSDSSGQVV